MPASTPGRRTALVLWAVLALVVWNVAFDRQVYLAAVQFTQEQIERDQRGEPVRSIESVFLPRVHAAAWAASVWGGAVLAAGVLLTLAVDRRVRRT